jgi:hypothetical protein
VRKALVEQSALTDEAVTKLLSTLALSDFESLEAAVGPDSPAVSDPSLRDPSLRDPRLSDPKLEGS